MTWGVFTWFIHVMFSHPPIFLIQHIQRLAVESKIWIVDAVWEFPGLCIEVDSCISGLLCVDVGDEEVVLVLLGAGFGRHGHKAVGHKLWYSRMDGGRG
jgi:hypothetical protein